MVTPTGHCVGAKSLIPKSEVKHTNHKQPGQNKGYLERTKCEDCIIAILGEIRRCDPALTWEQGAPRGTGQREAVSCSTCATSRPRWPGCHGLVGVPPGGPATRGSAAGPPGHLDCLVWRSVCMDLLSTLKLGCPVTELGRLCLGSRLASGHGAHAHFLPPVGGCLIPICLSLRVTVLVELCSRQLCPTRGYDGRASALKPAARAHFHFC